MKEEEEERIRGAIEGQIREENKIIVKDVGAVRGGEREKKQDVREGRGEKEDRSHKRGS